MHAMRFRMFALRVIYTENAEKAMPPRKSFKPVLSLGVVCWANCDDGWDGADVEEAADDGDWL